MTTRSSGTTRGANKHADWLATPPDGGIAHVTWWEGENCHNLDVWESEDAFGRFGAERLGPAIAAAGLDVTPQPTFHAPHEVFLPNAVTIA
jgi:hypothetical protein